MASKLTNQPPDLTRLREKNNGVFPQDLVYQLLDGRRLVIFHGTREMPIWGDRFTLEDQETTAKDRISALVNYLKEIQVE